MFGSIQRWNFYFYHNLHRSITERLNFNCWGRFTIFLQLSCSMFAKSQSPKQIPPAWQLQRHEHLEGACGSAPSCRHPDSHGHHWAALWPPMAVKDWVLLVLKDLVIYWAITPCSWHCSWPSFSCYDTSYSHGPPNCYRGCNLYLSLTHRHPWESCCCTGLHFQFHLLLRSSRNKKWGWILVSVHPTQQHQTCPTPAAVLPLWLWGCLTTHRSQTLLPSQRQATVIHHP